jgi:hypothetical protein
VFNIFQESKALFVDLILGDWVAHLGCIDKPLLGKVTQIALQLPVTHIGAVHNLGFTRFAQPQDIGHHLYIGSSVVHSSLFVPSVCPVRGNLISMIATKLSLILSTVATITHDIDLDSGCQAMSIKIGEMD